jgi:Domain of unknown function (DUF5753)
MDERNMSNDDYQVVRDGFIADLNQALVTVGSPSYKRLKQLSEQVFEQGRRKDVDLIVLAHSTTQEILTGRRRQPPRWQWVLSFVTTLQFAARKAGVDVDSIGTIETWKRKYDAVRTAEQAEQRADSGIRRRNREVVREHASVGVSAADLIPAPRIGALAYAQSEEDALSAQVLGMLRNAGAPQWWHRYRDVTTEWLEFYLYLESAAEGIRTYETEIIPGLLQIEAYASEVMRQFLPDAKADEISRLVELRMRRQELHRDNPRSCRLWAILEAAALRNQHISPRIMRAQINYLAEVAERRNVAIQVVPPGLTANESITRPVTVFRFPGIYLGDVVHLERPDHPCFLHERKNTEYYNSLFNGLAITAISPRASRELLRRLSREI